MDRYPAGRPAAQRTPAVGRRAAGGGRAFLGHDRGACPGRAASGRYGATGAIPIVGDVLRYTVLPLLAWLQMPLLKWAMFSPARVTPRFKAEYSSGMAVRPSQLRAESIEGALMIPGALAIRAGYRDLKLPVIIIAGEGDRGVFKRRSKQLRDRIKGSVLETVPGAGHMVHHLVPEQVARAVERIVEASQAPAVADKQQGSPATTSLLRAA